MKVVVGVRALGDTIPEAEPKGPRDLCELLLNLRELLGEAQMDFSSCHLNPTTLNPTAHPFSVHPASG